MSELTFSPTYVIINGKWTLNGKAWDELSDAEQKALSQHVTQSYYE